MTIRCGLARSGNRSDGGDRDARTERQRIMGLHTRWRLPPKMQLLDAEVRYLRPDVWHTPEGYIDPG